MANKLLWMVAGGTGGHIFPGLAIAKELVARNPELKIEFFGSKDRLEEKLIPKHGFPIVFLKAKPWKGKGLASRLQSLLTVFLSMIFVFRKISRDQPRALISVGGYVSMPVGLACWLQAIPIYIVEPNIRAGIANRILSRFAEKAFTIPGSDALVRFFCDTVDTGNPVLGSFAPNELRKDARSLLILGGSQGARVLCQVGLNVFHRLRLRGVDCRLVLQSGEKNLDDATELKKTLKLGDECEIRPFIEDVPAALAAADVVVARAGAMTITELSLVQVPTIFVPFPAAADDHQRVNARVLVEAGAAIMVDEKEKDFELKLENALFGLLSESESFGVRQQLAHAMIRFARPQAAKKIVDLMSL